MPLLGKVAVAVILLLFLWGVARVVIKTVSQRPSGPGLQGDQLLPCPNSPNCVTSQGGVGAQAMSPWPMVGSAAEASERIEAVLSARPDARVIERRDGYYHAEFTTRLLGFIDDVEILLDDSNHVVHFRSASRLGYGDLGTNRARMEELGAAYQAQVQANE